MWRSYLKNDALPLWRLAIPLMLTGLSQSLVLFFETLFLAHLGADNLAAGSLVSWLFGTLAVIFFGTLSAINILVSHRYGANDQYGIAQVAQAGLLLALVLALLSFGIFWNVSPILLLVGQSPTIVFLAQHYLHALAWGLVPNFIMIALLGLMIGLGHGRTILIFDVLSVLFTISFSFIFIFGKLGLPAFGIAGSGWGITASSCVMVIILGIFVCRNPKYRLYFQSMLSSQSGLFSLSLVMELLKVGLPIGVMYCLEVAFFLTLALIMGALGGPQWLAANQVALQYMGTLMSVIFAIAQAMTIRMGHLLGGKDLLAAQRVAFCGVATAGGLMSFVAILFWCCPMLLIAVDFDPRQVQMVTLVAMIISLFKVSALFQIVESIRIAWFGALRSLKDTSFPLLSSLIGFWLIPLPIGYGLIHYTSMGAVGLWWGMVCGALVSGCLLAYRFQCKIKQPVVNL